MAGTCPARGAARRPSTAATCAKFSGALHRRRGTPVLSQTTTGVPGLQRTATRLRATKERLIGVALRCARDTLPITRHMRFALLLRGGVRHISDETRKGIGSTRRRVPPL